MGGEFLIETEIVAIGRDDNGRDVVASRLESGFQRFDVIKNIIYQVGAIFRRNPDQGG
ncbi:hypothetical protein D3C87_2152040 [compost metagenome]